MEWTKVSVRHAEYLLADASNSVFRSYVRIMLLTSVMELLPNSEQCAFHLGRKNYNNLMAYLDKKEISLPLILNKVMEDVEKVQNERNRGKHRKSSAGSSTEVPTADKIREDKINKIKKEPRFLPPSIEELKKLISEKRYQINAITFFNHYESNGWMVGKNKMKSWHAAVANWNSRDKDDKSKIAAPVQREQTEEEKKMASEYRKRVKEMGNGLLKG